MAIFVAFEEYVMTKKGHFLAECRYPDTFSTYPMSREGQRNERLMRYRDAIKYLRRPMSAFRREIRSII